MSIVVQTVLVRTVRGAAEGRDFQENNLANPKGAHLTDGTFLAELESVADFFTAIQQRLGGRWSNRESLHLSSPGWQALGVIHHDMNHRGLTLTEPEKLSIYDRIAAINWSRTNREWVDHAKLGIWGAPKGSQVEQVIILGAGRNNTQAIIDFVRPVPVFRRNWTHRRSRNKLSQQAVDDFGLSMRLCCRRGDA